MRTILFILQKEFKQIFRNKTMLPIIFVLPILQMVVLGFAATFEIQNLNVIIVDKDLSSTTKTLTSKFKGSSFFTLKENTFDLAWAEEQLAQDKADLILHFNKGFEKAMVADNETKVQVIVNAINGTVAGVANFYVSSVIQEFNKSIIMEMMQIPELNMGKQINIESSFWFNPELNYQTYMVPGILVILVTVIGMFLSGLNLVREKEMGTTEQINVTPIKKYQFIVGKLLPFWLIALLELSFGLFLAKLIFDIPMIGSFFVLYTVATIYLAVVLGIGLFISTSASTQQQVMFVSFFFLLVFILMSGIFTPTESMPDWAQKLNFVNPIYYFMRTIRMILLKGSGFAEVMPEMIQLSVYAVVMLSLAVWRYRKVA